MKRKQRILKDLKKRKTFAEHECLSLFLKVLALNNMLPSHLQRAAYDTLALRPKDACITRIRNRCLISGRGRGVIKDWAVSRQNFRRLADEGYLAGVRRAS
jgi:small subunit ribosomal protein S14